MAVEVNYIDGGVGVEIVATGIVTGEEAIQAFDRIYAPEVLVKQKYQLVDRMQCEKYFLSLGDLKAIAELDKAAAKINPNIVIAITSPSDLMQRAAKIWLSYMDKTPLVARAFNNRASAIEWIEQQLGEKIPLV